MHNWLGLQGRGDREVSLGHTFKPWEKHNWLSQSWHYYQNEDSDNEPEIWKVALFGTVTVAPHLGQKCNLKMCCLVFTEFYPLTCTTKGSLGQAAGFRQSRQVTPVPALVWSILTVAKNSSQLFVCKTFTNKKLIAVFLKLCGRRTMLNNNWS